MAYSVQSNRIGSVEWVAQRIRDVLALAAGIGLALPLILPFG